MIGIKCISCAPATVELTWSAPGVIIVPTESYAVLGAKMAVDESGMVHLLLRAAVKPTGLYRGAQPASFSIATPARVFDREHRGGLFPSEDARPCVCILMKAGQGQFSRAGALLAVAMSSHLDIAPHVFF